jgi:ferredoxin-thioredoxin reductase catalytic subunit
MLEDAVQNGARRAKREQKRYTCTGGHSDLAHPTTMKRQYRPIKTMDACTPTPKNKKDIALFSATPAATSAESPTSMSPDKKKQRRENHEHTPDGWNATHHQQDKEEERVESYCVTPSAQSNEHLSLEKEKELLDVIGSLQIKNMLLEKRIFELDSSHVNLATTVEVLTSQMQHLQFQSRTASGDLSRAASIATTTGYTSDDDNEFNEGGRAAHHQGRKRRVQSENDELSKNLALLIDGFVKSPCFEDRRKFPTSRIAKIVVDSILSFEWTHLEFAKFSSRQATHDANSDAVSVALTPLLNVVAMKRHSDKSKAALLVDCMWDDSFLEGEVKECMVNKVRTYLRNHIFSPWKILKAMDLAGFNLSLSGLEVLRRIDVGEAKYVRGILPSKSTMLRTARKLEAAAESHCPFQMLGRTVSIDQHAENEEPDAAIGIIGIDEEDDTFSEGFEFDATKVTKTLFEAFGLMNVAKERPVELALTSDGAQLTNTISHVAAGLKFNDMALCNPISKMPMLLHEPESLVQSRNLCFPLRIVIAKDSKKTLDGFRSLYLKFSSGEIARALQCQAFKMSFPGDMKLQWAALAAGGAAKVKEFFCFICSCRSSTLHVPQDKDACALCKDQQVDIEQAEGHCYHYPFLADPEVRAKLANELNILTLLQEDGNATSGKMYVRRPNEVMTEGDTMDIDYQPTGQSNNSRAVWARTITDELASRGMSVRGTLCERQQRLRERLVIEQRAQDIRAMLSECEPKDRAMYLALQGVVCILHLENRVGLKSIESILRSGISNARKGVLDWTVGNGVSTRQEEYVRRITCIMQTRVLGSTFAPSKWRFPLTEDGNMGTLSMDNNRTRVVMNSIELLIEASFSDADENKCRLLQCFPHYRAAINILRKDTNATEEEIGVFQDHIDSWFRDWVHVFGKEGCTNYTHMLSSSHVMRYMQEWKCLNRFSQQGWEALNALIKSYFFRRTNRGGLSKNAKTKSKLLGIARWLQRRIMWYSGKGDALFSDENDEDDDSSYESNDDDCATDSDLDDDVLTLEMEEASSSDDESLNDNDD